jgi:hypothetical protein
MRLIDADKLCEDLLNRWSIADTRKEELIRQIMADIVTPIVVSQPTINNWIPCSERLPEEYGEYICTMENGQVQECGFVPEKQKGLITGWSTCEADGHKFLRNKDVLAWMQLPEPYSEEGGQA